MYVDDIIIIDDNIHEIKALKGQLQQEFEVRPSTAKVFPRNESS